MIIQKIKSIIFLTFCFTLVHSDILYVRNIYNKSYLVPFDGSEAVNIFDNFNNKLSIERQNLDEGDFMFNGVLEVDTPGILVVPKTLISKEDTETVYHYEVVGPNLPFQLFSLNSLHPNVSTDNGYENMILNTENSMITKGSNDNLKILNTITWDQNLLNNLNQNVSSHEFLKALSNLKTLKISDFNLNCNNTCLLYTSPSPRDS